MTAKALVYHINPPQYLAALIAYTVASDVLHIFEKERPNDLRPRKVLDLVKRYLDGEDVSRKELRLSADTAVDAVAAYAGYAAASSSAYANAAAYAAYAAYWAAKATSEEHVIKLIYSLMPQIIDYAIKNQVRLFTGPGDFTEVFDKLDDETREKVVWNMELLG